MKHRLQGMVIGFLVAILLINTIVYASTGESAAKIFYNNIKIYVDGGEIVPKDANGKFVEPFTMNGTTYLPVRALANAFGKDVIWDGKTQSVYLGKKDQNQPDNYLDRIQYTDFASGRNDNKLWKINGKISDYLKNDYTNGMLFSITYYNDKLEGSDKANIAIDYPLNMQYKVLSGGIVLPQKVEIAGLEKIDTANRDSQAVDVLFYGDGALIYKATKVTTSMPFKFNLDVKGVNQITIKIIADNFYTYIALTDLALYK